MKDKILEKAHRKICNGFKTEFLTYKEFEKGFVDFSNKIIAILNPIIVEYQNLLKNYDKTVLKKTKDVYIVDKFNSKLIRYGWNNNKVTVNYIKTKHPDFYKEIKKEYLVEVSKRNFNLVISVYEFVKSKTDQFNQDETENLQVEFWKFLNERHFKIESEDELKLLPQKLIQLFKEQYLSREEIKIIDTLERELNDISFSPFDSFIVNVGIRDDYPENAGWVKIKQTIFNNDNKYSFSSSNKDKDPVRGKFICVFVLQKKYLYKFCVTINETEQIKYIVSRDCEKVSIKNDFEIIIEKHHGNEIIIFDTKKEALSFRDDIIKIKEEGNRRN